MKLFCNFYKCIFIQIGKNLCVVFPSAFIGNTNRIYMKPSCGANVTSEMVLDLLSLCFSLSSYGSHQSNNLITEVFFIDIQILLQKLVALIVKPGDRRQEKRGRQQREKKRRNMTTCHVKVVIFLQLYYVYHKVIFPKEFQAYNFLHITLIKIFVSIPTSL